MGMQIIHSDQRIEIMQKENPTLINPKLRINNIPNELSIINVFQHYKYTK